MFDPALITKCADPDLKPAIVEEFIAKAGSPNPLMVTVRSGDRLILVPLAKTSEEAMAIVSKYVGNAVVRVGVTQYPAGVGIKDASEFETRLGRCLPKHSQRDHFIRDGVSHRFEMVWVRTARSIRRCDLCLEDGIFRRQVRLPGG